MNMFLGNYVKTIITKTKYFKVHDCKTIEKHFYFRISIHRILSSMANIFDKLINFTLRVYKCIPMEAQNGKLLYDSCEKTSNGPTVI